MSRTRLLLLAMICLAGITPLMTSPGSAGAASGPNPNKPVVIPIDETFLAPNLTSHCGFDVTAHVFGTITVSLRPSGVEFDRLRLEYDFSGPGGSFSTHRVENISVTAITSPDGTRIETVTASGALAYHTVVPGQGSLSNNSGREVVQFTLQYDEELGEYVEVDAQVLFDSGPNDELTDDEWAVMCEQLA